MLPFKGTVLARVIEKRERIKGKGRDIDSGQEKCFLFTKKELSRGCGEQVQREKRKSLLVIRKRD